ncbi:MAG: hypothetical protein HYY76_15335 [Acidobacteria bacterium]|nr:hypothetical protein [Acidobacteriota bacterium]
MRYASLLARGAVAGALAVTLATSALAQSSPAWNPPRTPDGQPDIQGFWGEPAGGADGTNIETSFQTAETLLVQGWTKEKIAARTPVSAIVDTPDGRIPYQPWAEARRQQSLSRYGGDVITGKPESPRDVNPDLFCLLGMPRLLYWQDFQVVQTPGYVIMAWERTHSYRIIPLDGRPHVSPKIKTYMGDARGRWEGNTLVVETRNLGDWTWFDSKGTLHSDEMTLVERYTYVDRDTIQLRMTVNDPQTLARPFTMAWTLKREHGDDPGYELMEYACAEGERAREVILE